jgi:hypothetical protein
MRKTLTLCLLMYIGSSCNNPSGNTTGKIDSSSAVKPVYAYTIKKADNWDIGSSKNTATVLSALKAFEDNKIDESISYFADSVKWTSDYMEGKFSKDSLKALFVGARNDMASIKIKMDDWESVISKDKKDEFVTLWYVQISTDKKGKTDSMAVINDFKLKDGKIAELYEAFRHYPVKK